MKLDAKKDKTGKVFEKNVGRLFKLMGYSVLLSAVLKKLKLELNSRPQE